MKGDTPPLQMDIVDGRMVPASAWDAERLSTYRPRLDGRGNLIAPRVNVFITQETPSWARRRYWAILGVVVKTCPLPPRVRTAQDLHDAVRKQIGFVDSHSSDGHTLTVKLRSTSKLDDQEFEAYAAEAYAELSEMTGVDVMTLGKEAPDVGRDEQEIASPAGETIQSAQDEAMEPASETSQPEVDAGSHQSSAADQEGGAETSDAPSSELIEKMQECLRKFIGVVTDKAVPDKKDRQDILVMTKNNWKDALPTRPEFVKACTTQMNKVLKDEVTVDQARAYLEGLIR